MEENLVDIVKIGGATSVGGLLFALFAKITMRKIVEEKTATSSANAQTDVIQLLRAEVDRLAEINETLSNRIADLQNEIIQLRQENAELKNEVSILNNEIKRFQRQ